VGARIWLRGSPVCQHDSGQPDPLRRITGGREYWMRLPLRLAAGTILLAGSFLLSATPAHAASNRTYLADQHNYGANRGFVISLENDTPDGTPATRNATVLVLGVADGDEWRYVVHRPGAWALDREYTVEATIWPLKAELRLDGALIGTLYGTQPGILAPADNPLLANNRPSWASGPGDYIVAQTAFSIEAGTDRLQFPLADEGNRPLPVMLFAPALPRSGAWKVNTGQAQVIRAKYRFVQNGDPRAFDPYIDAYGQLRLGDWPGRVASDADLAASLQEEQQRHAAWGAPEGYDAYGGSLSAPWRMAPTGYFRVAKRDGFWWLISPEGNPLFYTGICTAPGLTWEMTPVTDRRNLFAELPPRSGATVGLWADNVWGEGQGTEYVALHGATKLRKYGSDWRNLATQSTVERARTWGFSGLGKWSSNIGLPWFVVASRDGVPVLVRHPDVFDPSVRLVFRQKLEQQVSQFRHEAKVVGWTLGSEYDEIVTSDETREMLRKPASVPAKQALVNRALSILYKGSVPAMAAAWGVGASTVEGLYAAAPTAVPAADVEHLRGFFATAYYRFIYETGKELAPNHLYFGNWIVPGWWENENDWRLIAPWCDVIGYDNYQFDFTDARLARLIRETDKPVFCGEFSFPPYYGGTRGFNRLWVWAEDDADAGDHYARWLKDAERNPYCVGVNWFCYRDQPITGRGPGRGPAFVYGEDYAFGVIDEADRPKWDMVVRMRAANLAAAGNRFNAVAAQTPFALTTRALRISAGLDATGPTGIVDLDTVPGDPARLDFADALALARRGL